MIKNDRTTRYAAFAALKAKLKRGVKQSERGEFVTPEETLRQIEKLKQRRSKRDPI
jgi:hypothetical protein